MKLQEVENLLTKEGFKQGRHWYYYVKYFPNNIACKVNIGGWGDIGMKAKVSTFEVSNPIRTDTIGPNEIRTIEDLTEQIYNAYKLIEPIKST